MTSEIRQKRDKITHVMWSGGLANPITYVEQLSYLLYLKLLDKAENQHCQAKLLGITLDRPTLFPAQAERYRWSEWHFITDSNKLLDFVGDEVFPYMSSLVREAPSVATFFADARFQFEDPAVFREVVDIRDPLQFAKLGPDVKGDIFKYNSSSSRTKPSPTSASSARRASSWSSSSIPPAAAPDSSSRRSTTSSPNIPPRPGKSRSTAKAGKNPKASNR
jgi:HsdM N-terminal domain